MRTFLRSSFVRALLAALPAALAAGVLEAPAHAQSPPLKIVGTASKVTFQENGQSQTYFRIEPGKSLKLATSGSMLLLVPARPLVGSAGQASAEIAVTVTAPGRKPLVLRESLGDLPPMVTLSDGALASGPKVLRIPIETATAQVEIATTSLPGAIVGFARTALPAAKGVAAATPTPMPMPMPMPMPGTAATKPAVTPTPSVAMPMPMPMPGGAGAAASNTAMPMPMPGGATRAGSAPGVPPPVLVPSGPLIRRKVERLTIAPKIAAVVPAGPIDPPGAGAMTNVYVGGEMRFTFPILERRLSIGAEAGQYTLRNVESLYETTPFGATIEAEVDVSTRVTPILGSALWKVKLGERRAVFFGAAGGPVLTSRTESVEFRDPRKTSETRLGAQGRLGYEQKLGPGRAVVEASWLHVTESTREEAADAEGTDPFLGGALMGLHYRFVF